MGAGPPRSSAGRIVRPGSRRYARRSRAVALVTGAGIAIGVGGVVAVGAMDTSRQHLLTTPRLFGAPAPLVFESNGTLGIAELVDATLATPGVTALTRHIAINDDTTAATGPGGSSAVAPEAYVSERGEALPPIVEGDSHSVLTRSLSGRPPQPTSAPASTTWSPSRPSMAVSRSSCGSPAESWPGGTRARGAR